MQLDIRANDAPCGLLLLARGPPITPAFWPPPRASYAQTPETHSENEPWTALGISRATWYRRTRPPIPSDLPPKEVPHWYGIRVTRGDERRADIAIRLAGIPLFAPTLYKAAVPARRGPGGGYRPARIERIEYLFWRTMFIRINLGDPNWRDVLELTAPEEIDARARELQVLHQANDRSDPPRHVVEAFITSPGSRRPAAVSDYAVDEVRKLLKPNGCLYPDRFVMVEDRRRRRTGNEIDKGTALRLFDGPLAGHDAVCDVSDGQRVEMLTFMFGRDNVRATSSRSAVDVVEE